MDEQLCGQFRVSTVVGTSLRCGPTLRQDQLARSGTAKKVHS